MQVNPALEVGSLGQAAEQGDTKGQEGLGHICRNGEGMPSVLAVEWLRKAADRGNAIAQCLMGDLHRDGEGVWKDAALAAEWYWYRRATDQDDRKAHWEQCSTRAKACRRIVRLGRSGAVGRPWMVGNFG